MFTVRLGTRPAVVLCRYAALRDALVLQADAFSGRGATAIFERFTRGNGEARGWAAGVGAGERRKSCREYPAGEKKLDLRNRAGPPRVKAKEERLGRSYIVGVEWE